jgi:hypothetical protein
MHEQRIGLVPFQYVDADSFFLCLTHTDYHDAIPHWSSLAQGVDAVEARIDLLKDTSLAFVKSQMALLRRLTTLPIIYTGIYATLVCCLSCSLSLCR